MKILGLIWILTLKRSFKHLFDWLAEAVVLKRATEKELEMPGITQLGVHEGILQFRAPTMRKWGCCAELKPPQWEDPEDTPFTKAVDRKG